MSDLVTLFQKLDYGPAPESDQPAQQWLEDHNRSFGFYLNGIWEMPQDTELFSVANPATGEQLATCRQAGSREITQALSGAREAQPKWEKLTGHQRAKYIYALAREMQQHSRVLSVLETLDNGKPFRESRDIDIPLCAIVDSLWALPPNDAWASNSYGRCRPKLPDWTPTCQRSPDRTP